MPPPLKETDKDVGSCPFQSLGLPPKEASFYLESAPRVSGLKKGRQSPHLYLGHSLVEAAGRLPGWALLSEWQAVSTVGPSLVSPPPGMDKPFQLPRRGRSDYQMLLWVAKTLGLLSRVSPGRAGRRESRANVLANGAPTSPNES